LIRGIEGFEGLREEELEAVVNMSRAIEAGPLTLMQRPKHQVDGLHLLVCG